jgi:transcription termination/antitermination protein NusG
MISASLLTSPVSNATAQGLMSKAESSLPWMVSYTAPRHEKAIANQLAAMGVETYLPLYHAVRRWNGRRAEVDLPLFPNYVFVRCATSDRLKVMQHPGVVSMVSFAGKPACIPDSEIELLRRSISLYRVEPHPYLSKGRRVRVVAGPLTGLEATIVRRKGIRRLVASVKTIQRAFLLEVDVDEVELVPMTRAA